MNFSQNLKRKCANLLALAGITLVAACGGGGDGGAGQCELVFAGNAGVNLVNNTSGGLYVEYGPLVRPGVIDVRASAEVAPIKGKCETYGITVPDAGMSIGVRVQACVNSVNDSECTRLTGSPRIKSIDLRPGDFQTFDVTDQFLAGG